MCRFSSRIGGSWTRKGGDAGTLLRTAIQPSGHRLLPGGAAILQHQGDLSARTSLAACTAPSGCSRLSQPSGNVRLLRALFGVLQVAVALHSFPSAGACCSGDSGRSSQDFCCAEVLAPDAQQGILSTPSCPPAILQQPVATASPQAEMVEVIRCEGFRVQARLAEFLASPGPTNRFYTALTPQERVLAGVRDAALLFLPGPPCTCHRRHGAHSGDAHHCHLLAHRVSTQRFAATCLSFWILTIHRRCLFSPGSYLVSSYSRRRSSWP